MLVVAECRESVALAPTPASVRDRAVSCGEFGSRLVDADSDVWSAPLSQIGGRLAVVLLRARIRRSMSSPNGRQVFGSLSRLLHERSAEEARVRSIVNFISAIAVVFVLHAGFCPALCLARSAEPTSSHLEDASAPKEAPCHATSEAPSRDQTRECCDTDCSHFDSVALVAFTDRVVLDAPAAAFSSALVALLPRANAVLLKRYELASEPPPRNLLLVKNSFLI